MFVFICGKHLNTPASAKHFCTEPSEVTSYSNIKYIKRYTSGPELFVFECCNSLGLTLLLQFLNGTMAYIAIVILVQYLMMTNMYVTKIGSPEEHNSARRESTVTQTVNHETKYVTKYQVNY